MCIQRHIIVVFDKSNYNHSFKLQQKKVFSLTQTTTRVHCNLSYSTSLVYAFQR